MCMFMCIYIYIYMFPPPSARACRMRVSRQAGGLCAGRRFGPDSQVQMTRFLSPCT